MARSFEVYLSYWGIEVGVVITTVVLTGQMIAIEELPLTLTSPPHRRLDQQRVITACSLTSGDRCQTAVSR